MKIFVSSLAVLALATASAEPASVAGAAALKCRPETTVRFPHAPDYVYVVDGKVVSRKQVEKIPRTEIESISIACADDLYRVLGIEARLGGFLLFTAPGPLSALQSAVESVTPLQDAYLAEHGRFAATLEEVGWSDPTGLISIALVLNEDGSRWTATGTHRYLIGSGSPTVSLSGGTQPPSQNE